MCAKKYIITLTTVEQFFELCAKASTQNHQFWQKSEQQQGCQYFTSMHFTSLKSISVTSVKPIYITKRIL